MLQLKVELSPEGWDEEKQEFVESKTQTLSLEHSLVSISKWESKWHKPFISKTGKTYEETLDYIKCMTINNVSPDIYKYLTKANIDEINRYIEDPMTATSFSDDKQSRGNREIITAELIYHWMIALQIPFECQKWHLNKLLTLIRVCNVKNQPPKKMSKRATASHYAALNAARRKQMNTTG